MKRVSFICCAAILVLAGCATPDPRAYSDISGSVSGQKTQTLATKYGQDFARWQVAVSNKIAGAYGKRALYRDAPSENGCIQATIGPDGRLGPWTLSLSSGWSQFDALFLEVANAAHPFPKSPVAGLTIAFPFRFLPEDMPAQTDPDPERCSRLSPATN